MRNENECGRCSHPEIFHSGGTGDVNGWCDVTETPWSGGRGRRCSCNFYLEKEDDNAASN